MRSLYFWQKYNLFFTYQPKWSEKMGIIAKNDVNKCQDAKGSKEKARIQSRRRRGAT